jgi:hypothetical protein
MQSAAILAGMEPAAALRQREAAAARYRPTRVRLLLVAEAPPAALDRYFYFEDVGGQDSLFRYVVEALLDETPSRSNKAAQLSRLRDRGVFLIDLKTNPKVGDERLDRHVPDLVERARELAPEHIITIKANVCSLCQEPLRAAGLNVVDKRIPFPGSGQQGRFVEAMTRALETLGWKP